MSVLRGEKTAARPSLGELTRPTSSVEAAAHAAATGHRLHRSGDSALVAGDEPGGRTTTVITASDTSCAITLGRDPERTPVCDLVPTHPGTTDTAFPPDVWRWLLSPRTAEIPSLGTAVPSRRHQDPDPSERTRAA